MVWHDMTALFIFHRFFIHEILCITNNRLRDKLESTGGARYVLNVKCIECVESCCCTWSSCSLRKKAKLLMLKAFWKALIFSLFVSTKTRLFQRSQFLKANYLLLQNTIDVTKWPADTFITACSSNSMSRNCSSSLQTKLGSLFNTPCKFFNFSSSWTFRPILCFRIVKA